MVQTEGGRSHYFLLGLGDVVHCDLGPVRLPAFPARVPGVASLKGSKPANGWLPQAAMQRLLAGQVPSEGELIPNQALFDEEPRLGIGRDNARRSVQEGLLYQTRHLRLRPGVGVQLHLHGLPDASLLPSRTTLRLGGEGRQAALSTTHDAQSLPAASGSMAPGTRFVLYHLTPVVCASGLSAGIPAGFERCRHEGADCWEGQLAGQRLRILSVACARPLREGGWDLVRHEARAVQSLLAPGSVLYAQHLGEQALPYAAFSALADATGRGLYLAGVL